MALPFDHAVSEDCCVELPSALVLGDWVL